jgi:N-methylhydantoinase A
LDTPPPRRPARWGRGPRGPARDTAIFDAGQLQPGAATAGPAIVEAADTTTVVPQGWGFRVDEHGNGHLEAGE